MKFRTMYDGMRDEVSAKAALVVADEDGKPLAIQYVKQAEKEGTLIDNILRKYAQAGVNPFVDPAAVQGLYSDIPLSRDYKEAMDVVAAAQSQFEALGAEVRARFRNDPSMFLEFAADVKNTAELAALISPSTRVDREGYVLGEKLERVDWAKRAALNPTPKADPVAQPNPPGSVTP